MDKGIYGQYPFVIDFLTIPAIRQSARIIKYFDQPTGLVNLSLMRDKGVIWWKDNQALSIKKCKSQLNGQLQLDERTRKKVKNLEAKPEFIKLVHQLASNARISNAEYESLKAHHYRCAVGKLHLSFSAKTASRMQIGSNDNVLESRVLLHRLYGFPYIPGSLLKGIALAAFFHEKKLVGKVNNKDIPLNSTTLNQLRKDYPKLFTKDILENIGDLFGVPAIPHLGLNEKAGKVIFLDAWPEEIDDILDLDSWTVHYPKYYNEANTSEYPSDEDSPNPLLQLCVKKDKQFRFVLLAKKKEHEGLMKQARDYLQIGLEHLGIGAKPDYGYFNGFKELT